MTASKKEQAARRKRRPKGVLFTIKIPCLKCGNDFNSVDKKRNRICPSCNSDNLRIFSNGPKIYNKQNGQRI